MSKLIVCTMPHNMIFLALRIFFIESTFQYVKQLNRVNVRTIEG